MITDREQEQRRGVGAIITTKFKRSRKDNRINQEMTKCRWVRGTLKTLSRLPKKEEGEIRENVDF